MLIPLVSPQKVRDFKSEFLKIALRMMALFENPVLPLGSTILVTGANGLIGSHVVEQCLAHGYKVRGSVRDLVKNKWLQEHFDAKYGPGMFELIKVKDFAGPYDDAVKGKQSRPLLGPVEG